MAARERLAMNMLMDSDADSWTRRLAALRREVGDCRTDAPISASGNLSGSFTWSCERGRVDGTLLLAPTPTAGIQELKLVARQP